MMEPYCVYWQYLKPEIEGTLPTVGYWSNFGMTLMETNNSMTGCSSNHLSAFALIMRPKPPPVDEPYDLYIMGTILLTFISFIMLLAYLLAMIMLRCVRTEYSRMYMSIAGSCMFAQLFFLLAIGKRDDFGFCTTMAACMQFWHCAVMTWIMLESVHQLSRLTFFFNEKTNVTAFYNILGWGFPLSVVIALWGFPYEKFDELKFCWLYVKRSDIWFFAGPLVVLFIITLIIRVMCYRFIVKDPRKLEKDINYQRAWRSCIAAAAILPCFMLLWACGTLAVRSEGQLQGLLMLLVPLLNVSVGGLVFYFYFYRNDEAYGAIIEQLQINEKKKLMRYQHLAGINMKVKYKADEDGGDFLKCISEISLTDMRKISDDGYGTSSSDMGSRMGSRASMIKSSAYLPGRDDGDKEA